MGDTKDAAGGGLAAWPGAGRTRHRWCLRHPDPRLLEQTGFLGALYLSCDRHRGILRTGARPPVALARGHHHCICTAVDVPLPAMRPLDDRTARVPRHRGIRPRVAAGGVWLHVRPVGRRRSGGADLVRFARRLSVRRYPDRAEQRPCRQRDDGVRSARRRNPVHWLARARLSRRDRRRIGAGVFGVRRMGGARQSGHAGAARRQTVRSHLT